MENLIGNGRGENPYGAEPLRVDLSLESSKNNGI